MTIAERIVQNLTSGGGTLILCRFCVRDIYRGGGKSLARPGRKQARKNVRGVRDFNNLEPRAVIMFFFFLQGKTPKEIHAILTETLACFLPGRAKDLPASLYYVYMCMYVLCIYVCMYVCIMYVCITFFVPGMSYNPVSLRHQSKRLLLRKRVLSNNEPF